MLQMRDEKRRVHTVRIKKSIQFARLMSSKDDGTIRKTAWFLFKASELRSAQLTQWDSKYLVQIKTPMDVTRARAHYVVHACVCVCVCVRERERERERERKCE